MFVCLFVFSCLVWFRSAFFVFIVDFCLFAFCFGLGWVYLFCFVSSLQHLIPKVFFISLIYVFDVVGLEFINARLFIKIKIRFSSINFRKMAALK